MHQIFFVTVSKGQAKTVKQAIREAANILDNNSFSGEGGFYAGCKADWYVIGGRYSGSFQMAEAGKDMKDEKAWDEIKGKEVDAVEFTKKLHKQLIKYIKDSTYYEVDDVELFDDDEYEEYKLATDDLSHLYGKWIVVVDYHY